MKRDSDERDWVAGGVPQPPEKTVYLVFSTGQVCYDWQGFMPESLVFRFK